MNKNLGKVITWDRLTNGLGDNMEYLLWRTRILNRPVLETNKTIILSTNNNEKLTYSEWKG